MLPRPNKRIKTLMHLKFSKSVYHKAKQNRIRKWWRFHKQQQQQFYEPEKTENFSFFSKSSENQKKGKNDRFVFLDGFGMKFNEWKKNDSNFSGSTNKNVGPTHYFVSVLLNILLLLFSRYFLYIVVVVIYNRRHRFIHKKELFLALYFFSWCGLHLL